MERPDQALDPYVLPEPSEDIDTSGQKRVDSEVKSLALGRLKASADNPTITLQQLFPCRIDNCNAPVPRKYP